MLECLCFATGLSEGYYAGRWVESSQTIPADRTAMCLDNEFRITSKLRSGHLIAALAILRWQAGLRCVTERYRVKSPVHNQKKSIRDEYCGFDCD
jgi:hypothetical protein